MLQTRYKVLQAATTCGILKPAADKVGRQSELMLAEGGILRGGRGVPLFTREPVNPLILWRASGKREAATTALPISPLKTLSIAAEMDLASGRGVTSEYIRQGSVTEEQ